MSVMSPTPEPIMSSRIGSNTRMIDLPVINYRKLSQGSSAEAAKLFQAVTSDGFLQLDFKDSPAQATALDALPAMYKVGKRYFSQSAAAKELDRRDGSLTDRGYDVCPSDETFEISYDELRAGKISFPAAFEEERSTVGSFMEALDNACRVMLMSLSASLGLQDTDSLARFHEQSDTSETGLKFISEPTLARVADVGDNLHTDGGTFTVLFYEKLGLQSYFPCTQQWAFIPPMEDCCVVNVADSLARFSNGKIHSPKHRVTQIEDGAGERFYLSYFLRPGHKWLSK